MDFKLEDLTQKQINILIRFNKMVLLILLVLEQQKEKRNNYHRLYYNKFKKMIKNLLN